VVVKCFFKLFQVFFATKNRPLPAETASRGRGALFIYRSAGFAAHLALAASSAASIMRCSQSVLISSFFVAVCCQILRFYFVHFAESFLWEKFHLTFSNEAHILLATGPPRTSPPKGAM
jgi:hypothetical protein